MRELILAVQQALQLNLSLSDYRDSDIFIATSETSLPVGVRLPAFGIKDGTDTETKMTCDVSRNVMGITIICWSPSGGVEDAQVVGDATQPGALQMADDAEEVLGDDLLNISGMQFVSRTTSNPSIELVDQASGREVQQKMIMFEYERERES